MSKSRENNPKILSEFEVSNFIEYYYCESFYYLNNSSFGGILHTRFFAAYLKSV